MHAALPEIVLIQSGNSIPHSLILLKIVLNFTFINLVPRKL